MVVLVYWVYDFFFLVLGLLVVVVVCSAAVVGWDYWVFIFCFDFLLWVLWV